MRTVSLVIAVLAAVALGGCNKGAPAKDKPRDEGPDTAKPAGVNPLNTTGLIDPAAFGKEVDFDKLAERVMQRPDVDKAFDRLIEAVFEDSQVAALGDKLLGRLGDDPEIAAGMNAITDAIGNDQAVMRRLTQLIQSRPGITEAEVGALVTEEFGRAYQRLLAKPVELATQRTLANLAVDKEKAQLIAAIAGRLEASFDAYVEDPARLARWSAKVTELNGGQMPTMARAAELFVKHGLTEDRLATYIVTVLDDPATPAEVSRFLVAVATARPVDAALTDAARVVATSKEFQRRATVMLISALDPKTTPDQATKRVDEVFATDAFVVGLTRVVQAFLTEPSVPTIIDESLRTLWATPSIRKATDELLDGW